MTAVQDNARCVANT